jgi:hypothetical protein
MLINLGIKTLHIYHLEQHIILGFPAPGHDKFLVQTSTLPFRNINIIASTDQNQPSKPATLCHICISSCHWTSYATLYSTHHSTTTRLFMSRYNTQSQRCILIVRVANFHLCKDSQTDKRHTIIT